MLAGNRMSKSTRTVYVRETYAALVGAEAAAHLERRALEADADPQLNRCGLREDLAAVAHTLFSIGGPASLPEHPPYLAVPAAVALAQLVDVVLETRAVEFSVELEVAGIREGVQGRWSPDVRTEILDLASRLYEDALAGGARVTTEHTLLACAFDLEFLGQALEAESDGDDQRLGRRCRRVAADLLAAVRDLGSVLDAGRRFAARRSPATCGPFRLRYIHHWATAMYGSEVPNRFEDHIAALVDPKAERSVDSLLDELQLQLAAAHLVGVEWGHREPGGIWTAHLVLTYLYRLWSLIGDRGWPSDDPSTQWLRQSWLATLSPDEAAALQALANEDTEERWRGEDPRELAQALAFEGERIGSELADRGVAIGPEVVRAAAHLRHGLPHADVLASAWKPVAAARDARRSLHSCSASA